VKTKPKKRVVGKKVHKGKTKPSCHYCRYLKKWYPEVGWDGIKEACSVCNPPPMAARTETVTMRSSRMDRELIEERNRLVSLYGGRPEAEAIEDGKPKYVPAGGTAVHETGRRLTKKKPGVITRIVELLRAATKKKPITKEEILADLVKQFPDRVPQAMKSTISSQVPSCLKTEKGLIVKTNGKGGYWLDD
jgi:hypothetical protein